jgi:hypothetical protein
MKRGCIIVLVLAVAVPVVLCAALIVGSRVVTGQVENAYGKRIQVIVAAQVRASGPNPTRIVLNESQLESAFWHMPKVLGFELDQLSVMLGSGRIRVYGNGLFGSYLSYTYALSVREGSVRLEPVRLPRDNSSFDTIGASPGGLGSAVEAGINRALAEAGYRATGVDSTLMKLTIEIELDD